MNVNAYTVKPITGHQMYLDYQSMAAALSVKLIILSKAHNRTYCQQLKGGETPTSNHFGPYAAGCAKHIELELALEAWETK